MSHHSKWLHMTSDALSGYERLKVDLAQTSFFEGREFHFMHEFSIAVAASLVIQVVAPVNTVVFGLNYEVDDGWLRAALRSGGTPGGTFGTPVHSHPANNMTVSKDNRRDWDGAGNAYAQQVLLTSGGTHTGGTELEVVRLRVANATGASSSIGNNPSDEHGMAPGTYYLVLTNLGNAACTGVVKGRWEERP